MKKSSATDLGRLGRLSAVSVFLAALFVSQAFGGTITKTFEFGAGTANSVSNKRTFSVPCGMDVTAKVEYYRLGDAGAAADVPIVIELRKPGATADDEGAASETENATARRESQSATLAGAASSRGCSLPWAVRVKPASGPSPFAVKGTIAVSYNDAARNIVVQDAGAINLDSANTITVNFGGERGLSQGALVIRGQWNHNYNLMPIKLRFELLDPAGNVVASGSGYSQMEINPCCSGEKLLITYNVTECKSGQWKLRIKNISNGHDAVRIRPSAVHKPDCVN